MRVPDAAAAEGLLREVSLADNIVEHSRVVARRALLIADNLALEVDRGLIQAGALLHDIGRSQIHGFEHGIVGGSILREYQLPEALARIAEVHILGGLTAEEAQSFGLPAQDFLPLTLSEKLVCLADKMCIGARPVSIDQRFENWIDRHGRSDFLVSQKERVYSLASGFLDILIDPNPEMVGLPRDYAF